MMNENKCQLGMAYWQDPNYIKDAKAIEGIRCGQKEVNGLESSTPRRIGRQQWECNSDTGDMPRKYQPCVHQS